ncbi:MAG: hypothetical protein WBY94_21840, partial [Polyangiaceae bacterium]
LWHSAAVPKKWTIRALDKDHCVATWDQVLVQVWRLDTPLRTVTELDSITRAFMAEVPRRISSLAIIEATATPPGDAARSALSKFYRELGPQMGAAIVVAEGGGFRSSFFGARRCFRAARGMPLHQRSSARERSSISGERRSIER